MYPYGLNDVKLTPVTGSQVDYPVAQVLKFSLRVSGGELTGDDALVAVAAFAEAVEWELEAGGISIDAYAVMAGVTPASSGSGYGSMSVVAGSAMPYFAIYGRSLGDALDDVHVKINKAKITESIEGELKGGEFFVTKAKGLGVKDVNGNLIEIIANETAADLPSS